MSEDSKTIKIADTDRQAMEIVFFKVQNMNLQRQLLERDLVNCNLQLANLQKEMKELGDKVGEKYGIDLKKDKIESDGTVVVGGLVGVRGS